MMMMMMMVMMVMMMMMMIIMMMMMTMMMMMDFYGRACARVPARPRGWAGTFSISRKLSA
eukprot:12425046-Karenia_brevis.AAC.1